MQSTNTCETIFQELRGATAAYVNLAYRVQHKNVAVQQILGDCLIIEDPATSKSPVQESADTTWINYIGRRLQALDAA